MTAKGKKPDCFGEYEEKDSGCQKCEFITECAEEIGERGKEDKMNKSTFRFSEKTIEQRIKILQVPFLLSIVFGYLILFVYPIEPRIIEGLNTGTKILILFFAITFSWVMIFQMIPKSMLKLHKESEIRFADDSIEKVIRKRIDKIQFDDITKVISVKNKSGIVQQIGISSSSSSMEIFGFEDMNHILDNLKKNIPDPSVIQEKTISLDWSNPRSVNFISGSLLVALLFIFLIRLGGNFFSGGMSLLIMGLGLYSLIKRPFTGVHGSRFKKIEPLICIFFIIMGGSLFIDSVNEERVDREIKSVVLGYFQDLENEDFEAIVSKTHKDRERNITQEEELKQGFKLFDMEFEINKIEVLRKTEEYAETKVVYRIKKISGPEDFVDRKMTIYIYLKKSGNRWMLYGLDPKEEELLE